MQAADASRSVYEVRKANGEPALLDEIGSTGIVRYGGFIDDEFLPKLKGKKARATYREMADNDPVVGAFLLAVDLLMRRVSWALEPASTQPADLEVSDKLWGALHDMEDTWPDVVSSALTMLPFGFSWLEEVWKRRDGFKDDMPATDQGPAPAASSRYNDGLLGWRCLAPRAQETLYRWELTETGRVVAFVQQAAPNFQTKIIPAAKSLHFRTTAAKGNPEGRALLRSAYRPWFFKRRIEELEGIGVERDLAGLPMASVPERLLRTSANASDQALLAKIKDMVRNVRRNEAEGLVFPLAYDPEGNVTYKFELLTSGGKRQFDTDAVVARYDQRIAMSALADVILLGHEKVGSNALGATKQEMFTSGLEAWLDQFVAEINDVAIPRFLRYNGIPEAAAPTLRYGSIEQVDLVELGGFINQVGTSGAPLWPNPALLDALLEAAGLPKTVTEDQL